MGRLYAEHHVAVHLDEAAVEVEGEAAVAGAARDAVSDGLVQAEVEDGVHHAGHGDRGADRTETNRGSEGAPR